MTFGNEANSTTMQSQGEDVSLLDSSLTSLSWLQNLRVHDLISPVASVSPPDKHTSSHCPANFECSSPVATSRRSYHYRNNIGISLSPVKKCLLQSANFRRHPKKYRNNPEKPPFSYSTLIYLAIQGSKNGKVTLNEIYHWIKENFKFYRFAEPGWQSSIRHNLSLNELFSKTPQPHGKGNYWIINSDYYELLEDSKEFIFFERSNHYSKLRSSKLKTSYGRKRAHSHSEGMQEKGLKRGVRRKRRESEHKTSPSDLCGMPGDLNWISLLGSQRMHSHQHKPTNLSSPDLAQVGEAVLCSPLVLPATITAAVPVELPATPQVTESHGALLEEVVLKQDSPSPQVVLPWAEGNSQSPSCLAQTHPWAESKESTMHEVRNLFKMSKSLGISHAGGSCVWSPDHSWSSSSTTAYSSSGGTAMTCRTPLLKGTSIY